MKQSEIEDKFLDYIEQTLSASEMEEIKFALGQDQTLRQSFEAYNQILKAEKIIASSKHEINPNFSVNIINSIEEKDLGFLKRFFMELAARHRFVFGAVAALATLVIVVKTVELGSKGLSYKEITRANDANESSFDGLKSGPVMPAEVSKNELKISKSDLAGLGGQASTSRRVEESGTIARQDIKGKDQGATIEKQLNAKVRERDSSLEDQSRVVIPQELPSDAAQNKPSSDSTVEVYKRSLQQMPQSEISGALGKTKNEGASSPEPLVAAAPKVAQQSNAYDKKVGGILSDEIAVPYPAPDYRQQNISNTEGYTSYTENPRISVTDQPSSTFSIDVDTASYSNARRFLKDGQLPPKDSVRIEEFINYFDYNYPVQHEKPFTLSYEIAPSPLETDRYLLKLGIKARDASEEIKPWNLVFLVDVSGSMMDANKLPLVKKSLKLLVDKMRACDKISIVTYAGSAGIALEPSSIKEKSKILSAIDNLEAGGSTNGSGGINTAYDLAVQNKITDGVNRVVLTTDGDFNVGVTSQEELIKLIEEKRKAGITLTGLGYGIGNLKDGTLEQLADKGNGNYFYIDSFQEARKVLETDLVGNMEVVAKDVKLQIEFNPERVASYRLIGYENRKLNREDFNNDAIDAGEIGSGHTVTALYEVILANSELAKTLSDEYRYQKQPELAATPALKKELSSELAFLKIRYKEPEANDSKLLQYPIEAKDVRSSIEQASADFKLAAAVSYFGQLLRGSQFVGKYGYKEVLELAESAKSDDKKGYRQEFIELVKNAQSLAR